MSDKTASRLTRILAMLPWVIEHPGATVDEVCERFGYTRKELIKDLDLVFVCGLPGYGPGDLMVAYVEEDQVIVDTADYFARAPRLTAAEGLALLASGMTVMATGQGTDVLASAVDKLAHALVPDGYEILTVDLSAEHDLADRLRAAALEGRVVEIVYTTLSRGDTSTRKIEPWTVFTSLGNWYVSAFCRQSEGERIFRLDRIQSVDETTERFEPPASPPEPEVRYTPSEEDVTAVIRLRTPAFWVSDYYPVEIIDEQPDTRTVRFSAYDATVAAQLLIRLGADAALLEGDEVRLAVDDLRSRMLERYSS